MKKMNEDKNLRWLNNIYDAFFIVMLLGGSCFVVAFRSLDAVMFFLFFNALLLLMTVKDFRQVKSVNSAGFNGGNVIPKRIVFRFFYNAIFFLALVIFFLLFEIKMNG